MDMSEQYTHRNRGQMSRIDLSFNDRQGNQTQFQRGGGQMPDATDLSNEDFSQMQQRMAMIRDAYDKQDERNQMAEDEDQRTESDYHVQPTTERHLTSARGLNNMENIDTPYSHKVEGSKST